MTSNGVREIPEDTLSDLETGLMAEKAALEEELTEHGRPTGKGDDWDGTSESAGEEADPLDAANNIEELASNVPLVKELEVRYREVKSALRKMKDGTYGTCEECGEDIELARLEANAAARTCLAHAA